MTTLAAALKDSIAAACSSQDFDVSIGRRDDKSTWRIDFKSSVTDQQRSAAEAALAAFDPLAAVKAEAKKQIDEDAERQRLRRITGGAAKAMEYLEAKDQALAVLQMGEAAANALPNGGVSEFPVLAASVGTEAPSLFAAAQLISGRYEAYASLAGAIKRKVIEAKTAIDAASNDEAVRAVVGSIQWP